MQPKITPENVTHLPSDSDQPANNESHSTSRQAGYCLSGSKKEGKCVRARGLSTAHSQVWAWLIHGGVLTGLQAH